MSLISIDVNFVESHNSKLYLFENENFIADERFAYNVALIVVNSVFLKPSWLI